MTTKTNSSSSFTEWCKETYQGKQKIVDLMKNSTDPVERIMASMIIEEARGCPV